LVWWLAGLHYKITVVGMENIPAPSGQVWGRDYYPDNYQPYTKWAVDDYAFVLAPNHRSLADIVAVGYLKRPFVLVGKPFFAMIPGIKGFFEANGLLPVFRPGDDDKGSKLLVAWRRHVSLTGDEMIERAVRAASFGIPVEIYPEGTRDKDGEGSKGRFGAIQIAMDAGVPLLPAGIHYGPSRGLARRQVAMVIGKPMELPKCTFVELSKDEKVILADEWEQQVRDLREQAKQLLM